jgi:hypothetical protein
MTKAFYIFSFLISAYFNSFAQSSVNDYKYILVPNQFEFLNERDQYQINSLTKFLFNKYGYTAYIQDEDLPDDLSNNRCLGLLADVIKESGFLKTKLRIDLKDCNGNVIHSSKVGETREKEYVKAYNVALRDAFETFENLDYTYQPNESILSKSKSQPTTVVVSAKEKEEIARLREEIKTLKEEQENVEVEKPMAITKKAEEPKTEAMPKQKVEATVAKERIPSGALYAQPIENGFQIVDTTPMKVMILQNSGVKDVFTVEGKKALVYKKGEVWMYSESGDILKGEVINIKF